MPGKGERVREQILTRADELFYRQGFSDTAFANLAEACGMPKGNFYYYYKSKDALLRDVLERRLQQIQRQLSDWETEAASARERISLFIDMVRGNADNLSRLGCPIGTINSELGKTRPESQQQARALIEAYVAWLTQQLRERFPERQARDHALHLMAMAEGAALLGHVYGDVSLIERETRRMERWIEDL